MSSYEELQQGVREADELAKHAGSVEYTNVKITITIQSEITNEQLETIQKKYTDNWDLEIVRGSTENSIKVTGFRDKVREHKAALLKDFRAWDTEAAYAQMA